MMRLALCGLVATSLAVVAAQPARQRTPTPFSVVEASIGDMRAALRDGRTTSHLLVQ